MNLLNVVSRWPGGTHDSVVLQTSSVSMRLNQGAAGDAWRIGKSLFPLTELTRDSVPTSLSLGETHGWWHPWLTLRPIKGDLAIIVKRTLAPPCSALLRQLLSRRSCLLSLFAFSVNSSSITDFKLFLFGSLSFGLFIFPSVLSVCPWPNSQHTFIRVATWSAHVNQHQQTHTHIQFRNKWHSSMDLQPEGTHKIERFHLSHVVFSLALFSRTKIKGI